MKTKSFNSPVRNLTKTLVKISIYLASKSYLLAIFLWTTPALAANEIPSAQILNGLYRFGNALIVFVALGILSSTFIIKSHLEMHPQKRSQSLAEIVLISAIGSISTMSGMLLIAAFQNPFWLLALIINLSILIPAVFRLLVFRFNQS
ncbi:MAG TPA: hypothetical protein DEV81_00900 [Cyanobacteria bacterium UBA11049]|nr:hypothetical protein [Cyanobacteria bacterium UBA11049]